MNSQPGGMRRRAPSAKPMYQSGWVPAETGEGLYGPYTHTALMENSEAIATITPKTRKKNPPAFAAKIGMMGTPTTLSLVRSEEHTSELQSRPRLVCRLLLERKKFSSPV